VAEPIVLENDQPEFEAIKETASSIESSTATPRWNARRREYVPSEHSIQPLDYAFHLLGDTSGKTIVVLGYDGFSASALSRLDARLLYVDVLEDINLNSVGPGRADHALVAGVLRHVDPVVTARHIRRILKPGGTAVFNERVDNPAVVGFKKMQMEHDGTTNPDVNLTTPDVDAVCRAVGMAGRRKEFFLTTPLLTRMGLGLDSRLARISQRADAAVLTRFRFARKFALQLVWEARKER
jgi:hypothetical protein